MVKQKDIVKFLDEYLNIKKVKDKWRLNGLLVDGKKEVNKILFAVDSSLDTFQFAAKEKVDMLVVHHGILGKESEPLRDVLYRRLKVLFDNEISLYGAHIPLDKHPESGNNAQFFKLLNIPIKEKFCDFDGETISFIGELKKEKTIDELVKDIEKLVNDKCSYIFKFGKNKIKKIAFISGGAPYEINQAIKKDVDVYITGSNELSPYLIAKDAKINFIVIGHHSSEILGVRALADLIKEKFNVETKFIDIKTEGV